MQVSLNSIHCPLCRGTDHEPIVSTYKFDSGAGDSRQHPLIKAALCTNCGLVFENPCVDMQRSADHADGHCYPSQDILARQSRHQGHVNELRWQLLEHRIAMERCRRVYPEVTAVCETFERFEERAVSYDFFSFWYSLCCMSDARAALAKARRPLRDAGLFPFAVS